MTNDTSLQQQSLSTPSRPVNRNRHSKSSPQVPTTQPQHKKNNRGRRGNFPNGNGQPKHESALTKKFREAAQAEQGTNSDSAINSIVEQGLVTPPTTPGHSGHHQPGAYASDSALGFHTDGQSKKKNSNNRKKNRRRPTDIYTDGIQTITPPQDPAHTPPNDTLIPKATPNQKYAGGAFHSSPAPGALPLPRFFSKSVPTSSDGPSLSKMLAEAEAEGLPDASADSPPPTAPLPDNGPLDFLFQRYKEEQSRKSQESNSQTAILSPKPMSTPSTENQVTRNITPPSVTLQTSLGSPFGDKSAAGREDQENPDLLFNIEFPESKKTIPRPAEEVMIGPRFRPLSSAAYDPETLNKRQEKAKALKAALMTQQQSIFPKSFDIDGPPSPSPKPKPKAAATNGTSPQFSPTIHERRTGGNVGFAPAPRIRHFNQNRPVNPRPNGQPRTPRNVPQVQSPVHQQFDPVRAQIGESHIRGVLKLDTPIPAL
ncbi:hypothetical protein ABW19_dt0200622 [Dactylella cylindrospora]|nr:hypothetical protein ABW19_dt0200622 [Dactylella cylindrospora]